MPKIHYVQSSFTSGVLDPRLYGRMDIRQYFQGMSVGRNVLCVPLGGAKRRPGSIHRDVLPYALTARQAAATATATNGGTANNARDDNPATQVVTTTEVQAVNPYVVVHYDLGSAMTVRYADVIGLSLSSGVSTQFRVQYSTDNAAWSTMTPISYVDDVPRNDRCVDAGGVVTARYWRVARIGATDLDTAVVTLQDFLLWGESATVSAVRIFAYKQNSAERFFLVLTDRTLSIYQDGVAGDPVASLPSPYDAAEIPFVQAAASYSQILLFHEDHQTQRVFKNHPALPGTWLIEPVIWLNIPQYDFNDSQSPTPTAAVYEIVFDGASWVQGHTFQIEIEGARTAAIVYAGSATADEQSATAAAIAREVQKLATVGFAGVSCAFSSGTTYVMTLAEDSADLYELPSGIPLTGPTTNVITIEETTPGVPRKEDLFSHTRGWPRKGAFHGGRTWIGGCKAIKNARLGTIVNDPFNLDTGTGEVDEGIFDAPFDAATITGIFSGRVLQIFTDDAEHRQVKGVITPETFNPEKQTLYGSAEIQPVSIDGATIFVQKQGKVLRDFLFTLDEDDYSSTPISVLAQHLVDDIQTIAAWQGSGSEDANYLFIVNGDGTMAVYNTLRAQEVAAFTQWTTEGEYRAVACLDELRWMAVEREINGTAVLHLEIMDDTYYLDDAVRIAHDPADSAITGLDHLDGVECRVRADGFVLDNVTPVSGDATATAIGTEFDAESIEVGLGFSPTITTMPLSGEFGNGPTYMRKARVISARILVKDSLGVKLNGRPIADSFFDLDNFDEAPTPFSGIRGMEETSNWDRELKTQTISQDDPLPFHILALDIEMEASA